MLTKIFESLDEKVFTADLKEALEVQFNEAVEAKASTLAEAKLEKEIDSLNEKSEEHIEFVNEKAEEYVALKEEEMVASLDKYLDRIVEEFMAEAKETLKESNQSEKADMIIEAVEAMMVATGVSVAKIVEAKDDTSIETKLEESVEKYDSLIEENIALKEKNMALLKEGVIAEMKEGLTLVESEKFEKLAQLVEFTEDAEYTDKLDVIKESVKGAKEEKKPEEKLNEGEEKPAWAHLV